MFLSLLALFPLWVPTTPMPGFHRSPYFGEQTRDEGLHVLPDAAHEFDPPPRPGGRREQRTIHGRADPDRVDTRGVRVIAEDRRHDLVLISAAILRA